MYNRIKYGKVIISESRRAIVLFSLIFLCISLNACGNEQVMMIDEETRFSEHVADIENISAEDMEVTNEEQEEVKTTVIVHICGAVKREGVYELESGSRIIDAVEMAGGLTENACERAVNLSQIMEDAQKIYIPNIEEITDGTYAASDGMSGENNDGRVNINTADANALTSLKGIGSTRAEAIIEYRESNGGFERIEDIKNVSGIGESSFQKIKENIKVK